MRTDGEGRLFLSPVSGQLLRRAAHAYSEVASLPIFKLTNNLILCCNRKPNEKEISMKTHALHQTIPAIILVAIFLSISVFPCVSHSQAAPDAIVQFSDRTLAIIVRMDIAGANQQVPNIIALKAMPEAEVLQIPKAELAKITILGGGKAGTDDLELPVITDLTGLEHASQLTRLYLRNQDVADIVPLAQLTELTTIDLWGNHVVDVTPLSGLTKLTSLDLGGNSIIGNYIADITPLAQLTQLKELHVASEVTDITPVAQLTQLTRLDLGGNEIRDISPIADLTELTELDLGRNVISDVSPLAGLTQLTLLFLGGNQIVHITSLTELTELTYLDVGLNQIADLAPVANFKQLETLNLSWNRISNLTPLAELATALTELRLNQNEIQDITPIGGLVNLEKLHLSDNVISDVTPLGQLSAALLELDLRDNKIVNVSPLASLVNLEALRLGGNPITDTSPLSALLNENPNVHIDIEVDRMDESPGICRVGNVLAPGESCTYPGTDAVFSVLDNGNASWNIPGLTPLLAEVVNQVVLGESINVSASIDDKDYHFVANQVSGDTWEISEIGDDVTAQPEPPDQPEQPGDGAPTLTISTVSPLTEDALGGGIVTLTLGGGTFERSKFTIGDAVTVSGIAGVTIGTFAIDRESDTVVTVELTFDGNIDTDGILTVSVEAGAIAEYDGPPFTAQFPVSAVTESVVASTPTPLTPETLDGSVVTLTLAGRIFERSIFTIRDAVTVSGISGVSVGTFDIDRESDTEVTVELTFDGNLDSDSTLTFTAGAESIANYGGAALTADILVSTGTEMPPAPLKGDVNGDDVVNILDLVLVASVLGEAGQDLNADVNGDGFVNILDLVLVAGALGNAAAAPSAWYRDLEIATTRTDVAQWLAQAQTLDLMDATSLRGVLFLEQLLASLTPKETALLPNFPNPFNPETWIPYQLAEDADVTLAIYDSSGRMVRRLNLGHRLAGYYADRGNAAYWDGHNEYGEQVASGVYFYRLSAGAYSAMRKMLIRK